MSIRNTILLLFCFLTFITRAQISEQNIEKYYSKDQRISDEDYAPFKDSLGCTNYLIPYLNYYNNFIKPKRPSENGNGQLSQMMTMLGCYKEAIDLIRGTLEKPNDHTLTAIKDFLKDRIGLLAIDKNPIAYICDQSEKSNIAMINEAHDYPAHRAFVMSLLSKLKEKGYKYLALETLNNFQDSSCHRINTLSSLTQNIGTYTSEPIFGELIRYAIELGYTLIPYEYVPQHPIFFDIKDTVQFTASIHERDSMQAINLIQAMKHCNDGKILVLGGYSHTLEAEEKTNGFYNPFHPMALYFKELTHIDPLTINQIQFSETDRQLGGMVFDELSNQGFVNTAFCVKEEDSILIGPVVQKGLPDIYVMLPKTTFVNDRPTWLKLNGLRKKYNYCFPEKTIHNLVLVQAFYLNEVKNRKTIDKKIPADQFMLLANNSVDFYLRSGFSYLIVCRDVNNKIIYNKKFNAY